MKVSELAHQLNTTTEIILDKLRSLKLKAKGRDQEISAATASVVRSEVIKDFKNSFGTKQPRSRSGRPWLKKESAKKEEPPETAATPAEAAPVEKKTKRSKKAQVPPAAVQIEPSVVEEPVPIEIEKSEPPVPPEEVKIDVLPEVKVEQKVEKKASPPSSAPKAFKSKISDSPFIPLKPLPRKKRKMMQKPGLKSHEEGIEDVRGHAEERISLETKSGEYATTESQPSGVFQERSLEDLQPLELKMPITVKDFAVHVQQKIPAVLKKLMERGVFAHINQFLDETIAKDLAQEFGFNVTRLKTQEQLLIEEHKHHDDPAQMLPRAPVVTFMGHVDHGKTSLLDRIRKSNIVDKEHGGITQHIGASSVKFPKGRITFLDTPGHEAFTAMRARGAHITDIVVLVVAADEGVMPQTDEAIDHARAAEVPIIVALNKIDRRNADIDKVKKELAERSLNPEDWGGKTIVVGVSAVTGEGIETLLEMILLESEMLELKANPNKNASGIVIEAHLSRGRGAVASLVVQQGTLRVNDTVILGPFLGRVKAMFDDQEKPISEAGPSTPVEIIGLPGVPEAGEMFYVVSDEKKAKEIADVRQQQLRLEKQQTVKKITLEDLYAQVKEGHIKELNVILKADVQGSLEALKDSLEKIPSEEVKVKFIHTGVGDVNASDIILANVSNAIIIAFQVGVESRAVSELEKNPVDVREYRIIYDAVNDVKKALEGLLQPKIKRKFVGRVEVRQVFKLSKSGIIAGSYVTKGKVTRKAKVDVMRNGTVAHSGHIQTLKRFKDDVREVTEGFECGVQIESFQEYQVGDILEVYELESIARTI